MSDLDAIYAHLADGGAPPPLVQDLARGLLDRAARDLRSGARPVDEILRVVVGVGGYRAGDLLRTLVEEDDPILARAVLDVAPCAGLAGGAALRQALGSAHPEVVIQGLELLGRHGDASGTPRARGLLNHLRPELRAAAAEYLGRVAGPSLVLALRALESDPVTAAAARQAVDRIEGRLPRPDPEPWPRLGAPGPEAEEEGR